ncbi:Pyruvate-flavodoxin oxidoreductase, central domain protein [Acididesulfobacillus acetoxydans]|uniref:Pyruvate ferredoxin/flavodoxin oxidoreductase protein n=1 Tax=Acididesulfobacillus acetoxydans TaxID=1561005 RepID=A0A8S0XV34_9FIRM|nr:2-oxoacid:acceptor oxidoreductase family protein [Acididesulfobacillus acetoxydans]CAA7599977.1 Pyruvate-flavodoxin oxidoreductase, central domain protein [Acididesulfobacillus acetoxydans]CEJ07931.1 Pyruvate ferredoxin/flavodoxin oxidoreductase protein [Acididesulfobacillus acetoxydans]
MTEQGIKQRGMAPQGTDTAEAAKPVTAKPVTTKYVLAGFGGQGVLFVGKVLAQAGMMAKKQVTWIPAYGPEMRGGTANCSVIISDRKIGSPTVGKPSVCLTMNQAAYEKFLHTIVPGGVLYVNSSIVADLPGRDDIRIVKAPVNDLAHDLGSAKVANIVMLGIMQALTPSVSDKELEDALMQLAGKKPELAELNRQALKAGMEFANRL